MRAGRVTWCWLALVASIAVAACADDRPTTDATYAAPPTATAVSIDLAARVLPQGTTKVTVTATLSGGATTMKLKFTGDAGAWRNADLPYKSKSGTRYTFEATLRAPGQIGRHALSWRFATSNGTLFGAPVEGTIEVTCSDGLFCNGEERLTSRGCVGGPAPCDDDVSCTSDSCDEGSKTCLFDPRGGNCAECDSGNCRPHCGPHQQCGDDGCGGACTSAATTPAGACLTGSCIEGTCQNVTLPGTCASPLPLLGAAGTQIPDAGLQTVVFGDTSTGIDLVKPTCGGGGIKDLIYRFDVAVNMGVEVRMLAASGDPGALDTVLAIHGADCVTQSPFPGFCSDDASPPGGFGSRVFGPLTPGSYRLIATGFSSAQVGPFQLQVKFVPACVPTCDGRYCGSDGCGGTCGTCGSGQECSAAGRCFTAPCTPSCNGRQCGDDGCGGDCGTCGPGDLCATTDGRCVSASTCDHLQPVCKNCDPKSYCGADCACHKVDETLVDLIPAPAESMVPTIEFQWRSFDSASCSVNEGCVPGPGRWLLMRFNTDVLNQGLAGFVPGDPTREPDVFTYDTCHQHFHFSGFANFRLLTWNGAQQLAGHKLSYCMEDSYRYLAGPNIPCSPHSTCDSQGIQAGWADSYPAALDCQWVVLRGTTPRPTDVPSGRWYFHETCTNVGRVFAEHSYDNNCIRVPVFIPDVPDDGSVIHYSDLNLPPMP